MLPKLGYSSGWRRQRSLFVFCSTNIAQITSPYLATPVSCSAQAPTKTNAHSSKLNSNFSGLFACPLKHFYKRKELNQRYKELMVLIWHNFPQADCSLLSGAPSLAVPLLSVNSTIICFANFARIQSGCRSAMAETDRGESG